MKIQKLISLAAFALTVAWMVKINGVLPSVIFLVSLAAHEGFHFICARFLGVSLKLPTMSVLGLRFDLRDAKLSGAKGVLLYLSGSLGNLLFAAAALWFSRAAYMPHAEFFVFYNLALAGINLIPAYPMDAARAMQCILEKFVSELRAVDAMSFVSTLLGYIIFLGGIYLFLFKTDNAVLMVLGCLIFHSAAKERADSRSSFVKSRINRYKNLYKDAAKRFQQ